MDGSKSEPRLKREHSSLNDFDDNGFHKDRRNNSNPSPQPQLIVVKGHRRLNHDRKLACTQTDILQQDLLPVPVASSVATIQTRATLPPYAVTIINEATQRHNDQKDPQYQIRFKNTSLAIVPDKPVRHTQNARVFNNATRVFDFEQVGQRRGDVKREVGTSSSSIQTSTAFDPFSLPQFPQGGAFERLVNEWDDMIVSEDQKRRRAAMALKDPPRGLESLYDVDHFFIQPGYVDDFADSLVSLKNKYDVVDSRGQRVYYAGELWDATRSSKNPCAIAPKFFVKLFDYRCAEVMTIQGKWGDAVLCLGPDIVCYVEEHSQHCNRYTDFELKDDTGTTVLKLVHEIGSGGSYSYDVFDANGEVVGRISKIWSGLDVVDSSLAYSYGVNFPMEIPAKQKVMLLTALFVLYFKFVADSFREVRVEKCAWLAMFSCCLLALLLIAGFSFLTAYLFTR